MPALGLTRFAVMLALHPWLPHGPFALTSSCAGKAAPERPAPQYLFSGRSAISCGSVELRPESLTPRHSVRTSGRALERSLIGVEPHVTVYESLTRLAAFGHRGPDSRHVGMRMRLVMPRGELLTGLESLDWDADNRFLPRRRGRRLGPSGSLRLEFGQRQRRAGLIAWARLWPLGGGQAWESDLGVGVEGRAIFASCWRGQWVGAWRGRTRLVAAQSGADILRIDGALLPKSLFAQSDFSLTESVRGFEDEHRNVRALSFFDAEFGYARGNWLRMVIFVSVATQSRAQDAATAFAPVRWATGTLLRLRPGGEQGRLQISYQLTQRQRSGRERPWMHVIMLGT